MPPAGSELEQFPYLADEGLVQAVNMSIALDRPLLVKGPPGCGKTRLAGAVAHELGLRLYEWYIKSTSRARDGLYTIDMVRRLQDSQLGDRKAQWLTPYLRFGPLGEALRMGARSVVLIDEIDKADIDFPNDLLRELDEKKFTIEELSEELTAREVREGFLQTYAASEPPIIIVTSNDEKELPDAFLRRCLFYYIDFPSDEQLLNIIEINMRDLGILLNSELARRAVKRLGEFRELEDLRKKPATSELIDWVRILTHWKVDPDELDEGKPLSQLPYWRALFKHERDLQYVSKQSEKASS